MRQFLGKVCGLNFQACNFFSLYFCTLLLLSVEVYLEPNIYYGAFLQKKLMTKRFLSAQKMKFSIKDFFSKCDQICPKLRIWSH